MGVIAKHQLNGTLVLQRPFKGLTIQLVSKKDVPDGTAPTYGQTIDSQNVQITVRNRVTQNNVYSGSLLNLYRMLKKGDRDLGRFVGTNNIYRTTFLDWDGDELGQNLSLEFGSTYHGDYEVLIETKESIPLGSRTNSYIEFTPMWSDEAMVHEVIFQDRTIDQSKDDYNLGNGVEEIIMIEIANPQAVPGYHLDVQRVGVSSMEQQDMYNSNGLLAHTQTFQEDPTNGTQNSKELVIHDGEILTECKVSVEMKTGLALIGQWVMMYRRILPNPNADASQAFVDARLDRALTAL